MAIADILFSQTTTATEKARFVLLLRRWRPKLFDESVTSASLPAKKRFINKWLADFENIFIREQAKINVLGAFKGYIAAGGIGGEEAFLDNYQSTVKILTSKDQLWARLERNIVATNIKKEGFNKIFKDFDEFLIEARGLGITRAESVRTFMNTTGLKYTTLRDSAGRMWKPDNYARMYANTRDSQFRDEIFQDQTIELGQDVVQVSDHGTSTPICKLFEGKVYSLTGATPGLPVLPQRPGFHPNCKHVLVRRPKLALRDARKDNFVKNKEIKKDKATWTKGQKKTVVKQSAWNKKNRPPKGEQV